MSLFYKQNAAARFFVDQTNGKVYEEVGGSAALLWLPQSTAAPFVRFSSPCTCSTGCQKNSPTRTRRKHTRYQNFIQASS